MPVSLLLPTCISTLKLLLSAYAFRTVIFSGKIVLLSLLILWYMYRMLSEYSFISVQCLSTSCPYKLLSQIQLSWLRVWSTKFSPGHLCHHQFRVTHWSLVGSPVGKQPREITPHPPESAHSQSLICEVQDHWHLSLIVHRPNSGNPRWCVFAIVVSCLPDGDSPIHSVPWALGWHKCCLGLSSQLSLISPLSSRESTLSARHWQELLFWLMSRVAFVYSYF